MQSPVPSCAGSARNDNIQPSSKATGSSKLASLFTPANGRGDTRTKSHSMSSVRSDRQKSSGSKRPSTVWSQDSWLSSSTAESPLPAKSYYRNSDSSESVRLQPSGTLAASTSAITLDSSRNRLSAASTALSPLSTSKNLTRSNSSSSFLSKFSSSSNLRARISHPVTPDEPCQPPLLLSVKDYNRSLPPTPATRESSACDLASSKGKERKNAEDDAEEQERRKAGRRAKAIHELVVTEAIYAQDLAVIREVYKTCAQGQQPEEIRSRINSRFDVEPKSAADLDPVPTWSTDDVDQVFLNVDDLFSFSETLVASLDAASGEEYGLDSDDTLGAVFLDILPHMQTIYQPYVEKHAGALRRLDQMPQDSLEAYTKLTSSLAQGLTQSWDIQALLIKPIQRCLKYPLLLQAIVDLTPENHPDLINLQQANTQALHMASALNEGRRARELVEHVLRSKGSFSRFSVKKRKSEPPSKDNRKAPPPLDRAASSGSIPQIMLKKWSRKTEKAKTALGFESAVVPTACHATFDEVNDYAVRFDLLEMSFISFGEEMRVWSASAAEHLASLKFLTLAFIETCRPMRHEQYEIQGLLDRVLDFQHVLTSCEMDIVDTTTTQVEGLLPTLEKLIFAFKGPRKIILKRNAKLLDYQSLRTTHQSAAEEAATDFASLSNKLLSELPTFLSAAGSAFNFILAAFTSIQAKYFHDLQVRLVKFQESHCTTSTIPSGGQLVDEWRKAHMTTRQQLFALPSCRTEEQITAFLANIKSQEDSNGARVSPNEENARSLSVPLPRSNMLSNSPSANRQSIASSDPSFAFSSASRSSTYISSELDHLPVLFSAVTVTSATPSNEHCQKDYPMLSVLAGEKVAVLVEEEAEEPLSLVRTAVGEVGYIKTSELVGLR